MSTINFADLNLEINKDVKTFDFNGNEITVKQYLPAGDKYDLVMITLQKAEERGIYNPVKLDMYFHLNLVFLYTNIEFTVEEIADAETTYDKIVSSGLLEEVLKCIPEDDYIEESKMTRETYELIMKYRNTAGAVIQSFIGDLPKNAEAAKKVMEEFDPSKFQELMNFVTAANGGRPIKLNG